VRWATLRVGDGIRLHMDEAGEAALVGAERDGFVAEVRTRANRTNALVVNLKEGLLSKGQLLTAVMLTPRHRENFYTFISWYLAVYVSPVGDPNAEAAFKAVFGIASLRRQHVPSRA